MQIQQKKLTTYKILYYKFFHKITWNHYIIPTINNNNNKNILQKNKSTGDLNKEQINKENISKQIINIKKPFNTKFTKKQVRSKDKTKCPQKQIDSNTNNLNVLLYIPNYETRSSSQAMVDGIPKYKNKNKQFIETITKFGITTYSFDKENLHYSASTVYLEKFGKEKLNRRCLTRENSKNDYEKCFSENKSNYSRVNSAYNLTTYTKGFSKKERYLSNEKLPKQKYYMKVNKKVPFKN